MPRSVTATVTVFASPSSWIESDAVDQCHQVAALDGMVHVAAMPDLHPGKGARSAPPWPRPCSTRCSSAPTSAAGSPCSRSPEAGRAGEAGRAVPRPGCPAGPDDPARVHDGGCSRGPRRGPRDGRRGNHFVELARIGTVFEPDHARRLGLAAGDLVLVVHSGSRGLGERILRDHTDAHGAGPAADPDAYLARHDAAVRWGSLNRRLLAARVAHALGAVATEPVVDQCHNWSRSAMVPTCTARARRPAMVAMC
jgi:release factor H-coupled RctB family protein